MKHVYLDSAASTRIDDEVIDYMDECNRFYGNPSCPHGFGQHSKRIIEQARDVISDTLNAKPNEIVFTSGGTEANNLAIKGVACANKKPNAHIITTVIEHDSVILPCRYLETQGFKVTYLPVDSQGMLDMDSIISAINDSTMLISVVHANNEIGSIQRLAEIGAIAKEKGICFHTDAVQAFPCLDIDVNALNVDLLSISSHKFHAAKGCGALYFRDGIVLEPLFHGGGQEFGLRSGTENVTAIAGMGLAAQITVEDRHIDTQHIRCLREMLIDGLICNIPDITFNSPSENALDSIVNVSFKGVSGTELVSLLSREGIYVTSGAACSSSTAKPSRTLTAIGLDEATAMSAIRFSIGKYNSTRDIMQVLNVLPMLVENLRKFNY